MVFTQNAVQNWPEPPMPEPSTRPPQQDTEGGPIRGP